MRLLLELAGYGQPKQIALPIDMQQLKSVEIDFYVHKQLRNAGSFEESANTCFDGFWVSHLL